MKLIEKAKEYHDELGSGAYPGVLLRVGEVGKMSPINSK